MKNKILKDLRDEIFFIDKNILKFLNKRNKLVKEIAKEKIKINKPIKDLKREKKLLSHLHDISIKYNLDTKYIHKIYKIIINYSIFTQQLILNKHLSKNKIFEKNIKISFLGPNYSYSYIAIKKYAQYKLQKFIKINCNNFKEVINCVEQKKSDIAILPIENNNSGSINEVYDLLNKTNLSLIDEIYLPIHHCILAQQKISLNQIKKIYSHPQSFSQCSKFIDLFPNWTKQYTLSTSSAMEKVYNSKKSNCAALGNAESGIFYKLQVLKKNISNYKNNITRFIILSSCPSFVPNDVACKTTLIVSVCNKFTCLTKVLLIFDKYKICINKLESRPIEDNMWEEIFFIDLIGNLYSDNMQKALQMISYITKFIKILGCYPINNSI